MMNTDMPYYKDSVRQLQVYLYDISRIDGDIPRVNPDGIYRESTADAVSAFQRKHGIYPNGRVDYKTWQKLSREHEKADTLLSKPRTISPFDQPLKDGMLRSGDRSELVKIVKIMLRAIGTSYPLGEALNDDDIYDLETENAIKELQYIYGLTADGVINKETWNSLASAYEKHRVPY